MMKFTQLISAFVFAFGLALAPFAIAEEQAQEAKEDLPPVATAPADETTQQVNPCSQQTEEKANPCAQKTEEQTNPCAQKTEK